MFLSLSAEQAMSKCEAEKVLVSTLEELPNLGVRLVCQSVHGADVMRRKLKSKLLSDDTARFRARPQRPLW
jgi:hypothetical protein